MIKYVLILLLFIGCSSSKLIPYEVDVFSNEVHLYMSNYHNNNYQVFIDDGQSNCYKAVTQDGEALLVCSPMDLICYMENNNYQFKETISYAVSSGNWYTVWIFKKKKI